jgi:hypothetical protein
MGRCSAYPDRLTAQQARELVRGHRVGSREVERSGRSVGVKGGVQNCFHCIVSVQRCQLLGPAAKQRDGS